MTYAPTTLSDVLAHVRALETETEATYEQLGTDSHSLKRASEEARLNQLNRYNYAGQLLALAKVRGYLEARIDIYRINQLYK